jgi:hypothetical protein
LVYAALVIDAAPPVSETSPSSPLVVSPRVIDFGCIDARGTVEKTFLASNPTKRVVTIRHAKTSCGCTRIEGNLADVAPGTSRQFKVRITTNSREGFQRNFCVLETDDGMSSLEITGFVRVETGFSPSSLDFGIVDAKSSVERPLMFCGPATSKLSLKVPLPLSYQVSRQVDEAKGLALDRVILTLDPKKIGDGLYEHVAEAAFGGVGDSRHVRIPVRAPVVQRLRKHIMLLVKLDHSAGLRKKSCVVPGILAKDVSSLNVRMSSPGLRVSHDKTDSGELLFNVDISDGNSGPFEARVELCAVEDSREVQYTILVIVTGESDEKHK